MNLTATVLDAPAGLSFQTESAYVRVCLDPAAHPFCLYVPTP